MSVSQKEKDLLDAVGALLEGEEIITVMAVCISHFFEASEAANLSDDEVRSVIEENLRIGRERKQTVQ